MQGADDGRCQTHRGHGAGACTYGRIGKFIVLQIVRFGQVLALCRVTLKTPLIADAAGVHHHIDRRAACAEHNAQETANAQEMLKLMHGV